MDIRATGNPNVFRLSSFISSSGEAARLRLPVEGGAALYSRFKHVYGFPAPSEGGGLPLHKLRAIDSLIERLVSLRRSRSASVPVRDMAGPELDETIDQLRRTLHDALSAAPTQVMIGGPSNDMGLSLDIVA